MSENVSGLFWRPEEPFPGDHQTKGKQVIGDATCNCNPCISENIQYFSVLIEKKIKEMNWTFEEEEKPIICQKYNIFWQASVSEHRRG